MAILELYRKPRFVSGHDEELRPHDAEFALLFVDTFYAACLKVEYKHTKFYRFEYGASVEAINYQSPLKIISSFKNISVSSAKWVLDRVLFHEEEKRKRQLHNESLVQDIIKKSLDNLESARSLRQRLIEDGVSPEEAAQKLGQLLDSETTVLRITGPQKKE